MLLTTTPRAECLAISFHRCRGFNRWSDARNISHDFFVDRIEFPIAPRVDALGHFDRLVHLILFRPVAGLEGKARDVSRAGADAVEHAVEAQIGAGRQATENSGLAVITNDRSEKLPAGCDLFLTDAGANLAVGIFQIARGG